MKKVVLVAVMALVSFSLFAQKDDPMTQFESYQKTGKFKVDGNEIVVSKVIENIDGSKDDIYIMVKNFFARNYKDANSVLQTDDKEAGVVIGKGYFSDIYKTGNTYFNAYHILRVDIKDNRVRIICNASTWNVDSPKNKPYGTYNITDYAPFTDKKIHSFIGKNNHVSAFVNLVNEMHLTILAFEKSLKNGALKEEKDDW